jgi:hypothetical protein
MAELRCNRALPPGYKEGIQFGMISWFVPLSTYPAGYGGNPKESLPLTLQTATFDQWSYFAKCGHVAAPPLIPAEKRPNREWTSNERQLNLLQL